MEVRNHSNIVRDVTPGETPLRITTVEQLVVKVAIPAADQPSQGFLYLKIARHCYQMSAEETTKAIAIKSYFV